MNYFKKRLDIFFLVIFLITVSCIFQSPRERNNSNPAPGPEEDNVGNEAGDPIFLADPTVFSHDGMYYLYGTAGKNSDLGFEVFLSKDLTNWKKPSGDHSGWALVKEDVFGDKGFWAPQVFEYEGTFYMAYTANENIAIATADSPLGPFRQNEKRSLQAPVKQIDPFIFIDTDGKKYLYHVRLTEGNRLFVAEMEEDFSEIKAETLQECIAAEEGWENTQNVQWPVAEGPSILKHDSHYYFIYSTNDFRNPDYAVGYAIADNPYGPWEKHQGNPIFTKADAGINGTGHGDFFFDDKNQLWYVLHTHFSDQTVSPRRTALVKLDFQTANDNEPDILQPITDTFCFLHQESEP